MRIPRVEEADRGRPDGVSAGKFHVVAGFPQYFVGAKEVGFVAERQAEDPPDVFPEFEDLEVGEVDPLLAQKRGEPPDLPGRSAMRA